MTYEMALLDRKLKGREEARTKTMLEMVKNLLAVGATIRQVQNSSHHNQLS